MRAQIIGTGAYLPAKVVTNVDLEKIVETTDAWINDRTGIRSRHVAAEGETTSDMCAAAARQACAQAGVKPEDVDLIVVGTVTPDMPLPSCAALVQAKLGARKAFAFDVLAACAGSIYGLAVAEKFVVTGQSKRALVIGAELLTRIVDWQDRNTCVLFGDAAGAMLLGPGDGPSGILSTHLHSDGNYAGILKIPAGGSAQPASAETVAARGHYVKMQGKEVFKFAVRALEDVCREALAANGLSPGDVQHVVMHQANLRILEAVVKRLEIPIERCVINIDRYANTSSASVPITLDEANRSGRLRPGDTVLMAAIGGGIAWGAAVVRW